MIPQNFLLAFLSLQAQDQGHSPAPQSSQLDLNVFDSVSSVPSNYEVKGFRDVEPARVENHEQQSVISNDEPRIHWFPLDKFDVGQYSERGLEYQNKETGLVQITTNTTSYLWSLANSFPFINPEHNNKNVISPYPKSTGITINFQKNWKEVHVTLGYLGPNGFHTGKFAAEIRANKKFSRESFTIGEKWTRFIAKAPKGGPNEGIDHISFFYGVQPASYTVHRLVIESVTWS